MALNWDVTKIENYEEVTTVQDADGNDIWNPVTESLVWLAMFTDIGWEITEENAAEFYARIRVYEKLHGTMLKGRDEETGKVQSRPITPADVQSHIGLSVNVSGESRSKFMKKQVERALDDGVTKYKREVS